MKPTVKEFFDNATWTLTYVVYDNATKDAIVIDPVWDYDPASANLKANSVDQVLKFLKETNLNVHYILETHAHADHISGSQVLKKYLPNAKVGIGARIKDVQSLFKNIFNLGADFKTDGSQFDLLLDEEKSIFAGSMEIKTIFTPGHTPACSSFVVANCVFTGDALFMPDSGTGRCDFPAGSANELYTSIHEKIYKLPDEFRVFVGHDYLTNGRALEFQSTIKEEKEKNVQLSQETSRDEYVQNRIHRDQTLAAPRLLLPSIQVNINAGRLPEPEENGARYLKIPLKSP